MFEDIARLGEGENEEVIGEAIGVVDDGIEYGDDKLEMVEVKTLVFDLREWEFGDEYEVEEYIVPSFLTLKSLPWLFGGTIPTNDDSNELVDDSFVGI